MILIEIEQAQECPKCRAISAFCNRVAYSYPDQEKQWEAVFDAKVLVKEKKRQAIRFKQFIEKKLEQLENLHDALHIIEKWGFEAKTILTWVKNKIGIGSWLRGKTEHCILAIKGNPVIKLTNQTTALIAPTQGHSKKPDEFYQLVDSLCIGRKLDYFAGKRREGWKVYGTIEGVDT